METDLSYRKEVGSGRTDRDLAIGEADDDDDSLGVIQLSALGRSIQCSPFNASDTRRSDRVESAASPPATQC
jgi:hypothetical protein